MQSADHAQTSGPVCPHENKTYTVFAPPGRCCHEYIFLLLQRRSALAVNKNKGQAYACPADKKFPVRFQGVLQGVRFVAVGRDPCGKRKIFGFDGVVAMIDTEVHVFNIPCIIE